MKTRQGRRIALVVTVLAVSLGGLAAAGHVFSQGGMGPDMMGPGYMDPEARGRGGWGHMGRGGMMMGLGMGGGMMGGGAMQPGMMGPGGMGPGMMGPGGMRLLNPWLAERLDLTESQQERVDALEEGLLEKQFAMMRAMHAQRPAMWNRDPAEKVDVDAVMASHDAMMSAGREVMRARLQAWNDVLDLLTDEQRSQLRDLADR